jgi:formate hydrogenlyase subunit 3/multisubunit Na+/H+ antiporter MnhD subunit
MIILAAVQANHPVYAAFAVIASILTLASFAKVQKYAFFGKPDKRHEGVKEVPVFMCGSMTALAIICVIASLLAMPTLSRSFLGPAAEVLMNGTNYAKIVFGAIR